MRLMLITCRGVISRPTRIVFGRKVSCRLLRFRRRDMRIVIQAALAATAVKSTVPTVATALTAPLLAFSHSIAASHHSIPSTYPKERAA